MNQQQNDEQVKKERKKKNQNPCYTTTQNRWEHSLKLI